MPMTFSYMKFFRALPIRQKMLVMTLSICGAVLCFAVIALFTFQVLNFRSDFQRDTATLAVVIANNSTAALEFGDDAAATEVVGALRARAHDKNRASPEAPVTHRRP